MEVEAKIVEAIYKIHIPNFRTYTELSHTFSAVFPIFLNNLRMMWQLTVIPFQTNAAVNKIVEDSVNYDVGVTLKCLKCNVNQPKIEVYCNVVGREQHEKKLQQSAHEALSWHGILIPRLSLDVYQLLKGDLLRANLRFIVNECDMSRAVDSLGKLSGDLGDLFKNGLLSDVDVVTSDNKRIPVHRAVLEARSNLFKRAKLISQRSIVSKNTEIPAAEAKTPQKSIVVTKPETPINSTFGSLSSGYESVTSGALSPDSPPLFQPKARDVSGSNDVHKVCLTPSTPTKKSFTPQWSGASPNRMSPKPSQVTPNRSSSKYGKPPITPKRPESAKKILFPSSQHSHLSSRMSPCKRLLSPSRSSPCKKLNARQRTPPARVLPEDQKENNESKLTNIYPVCVPGSGMKNSLEGEHSALCEKPAPRWEVKVNMSYSVAYQLLSWIYTGECNDLESLARPLLVAGLRHNVESLARVCEYHLAADLVPSITPDILYLARKYGADILYETSLEYALSEAAAVTSQPSWKSLATRAPDLVMEFSQRLAQQVNAQNKTPVKRRL